MKKSILTVVAIVLTINTMLWAQTPRINVQHNGVASFYTDIPTAVTAALSGDTIYLAGGTFTLPANYTINKTVHIIGAGHYPDSTVATGTTVIQSALYLIDNADNGSISGVQINFIYFGTTSANQQINNYKISRCNIYQIQLAYSASATSNSTGLVFSENAISNIAGCNSSNCSFEKNIIQSLVTNFTNVYFKNNIFLSYGQGYVLTNVTSSLFENNIFWYNAISTTVTNNIFNNNIFRDTYTFPYQNNIGQNNLFGSQFDANLYIAHTNTSYAFSYTDNYHLKATCAGKNAGTDGTDIGLYGTAQPYKECAVPFNPHIRTKTVSTQLDGTGKLHIDINVSAQDR